MFRKVFYPGALVRVYIFWRTSLFLSSYGFSPCICLSSTSGKEFLFIFLRMGLGSNLQVKDHSLTHGEFL